MTDDDASREKGNKNVHGDNRSNLHMQIFSVYATNSPFLIFQSNLDMERIK